MSFHCPKLLKGKMCLLYTTALLNALLKIAQLFSTVLRTHISIQDGQLILPMHAFYLSCFPVVDLVI